MKSLALASLEKSFSETKVAIADYVAQCDSQPSELDILKSNISSRLDWLQSQINGWSQDFYRHLDGHLPAIVGADRMKKALKALGLDGDFDVQKRVIYASETGQPSEVQFSLKLK